MDEATRLQIYFDLLQKWSKSINLVSKASLDDAWGRHFQDSLQLLDIVQVSGKWVDLGSGGGFPGAVVAIAAQARSLRLELTLVESDQRKSAFLRTVSRETSTPFQVCAKRIEDVEALHADILSARALTELQDLLGYAQKHLKPAGVAVFPKGASWQKEVAAAQKDWSFDCLPHKSKTNPQAVILEIRNIRRV